ncbi:MAG TPA: ABC transporter permease [Bryobacteraceae bacterium]|nr:ABC transporter permease [Bryobacteraceae bacterium]
MHWLLQDARFGIRTLLKDRGFLATAVLALALGIGSVTVIFSVIDNVLLEPFPYTDGQRLVAIQIRDSSTNDFYGREFFSPPEFLDYQEQNRAFDRSIGVRQANVIWTLPNSVESFRAAFTTGNTFQFLGVAPLLGRYAIPDDARPGAPPVVVLSYKVWQGRFSRDPAIVGKTFILDGTPRTVVGVMPKRFAWWGADIWIPAVVDRADNSPTAQYFFLLGHLKPGLTPASAQPDVEILARHLAEVYPKAYPKKFTVHLQTLSDNVVGKFRETLYTLLAAVGLLLLIACANVANLLLAKATAREKEFAIRSSLGAGRWQVIRQLLVESILLGLCGAAVGCLFAWGGLKALLAVLPQFTFPDEADISLNLRVLAATAFIAVLTSLIFGMAPAFGSFSKNLSDPLKAGGRGNSGFRRGRLRNVLIVAEVALSLLLLSGAGLLMRSFMAERQADLGLDPKKLLASFIDLGKKYPKAEDQYRFVRELTSRLDTLPGVISASGALDFLPFGGPDTAFEIPGKTHTEKWTGQMGFVDPNFFDTLGFKLLQGRLLTNADVTDIRKVVVINAVLAGRYFAGENPIGKQIELTGLRTAPVPVSDPRFEIIGVVSDIRNHGLRDPVIPEAYGPISGEGIGRFMLYVRTAGNPASLTKPVESEVLKMDSNVHPQQTLTLEAALDANEFAQPRFGLQIFSVFAGVGLVLVALGIYSVVSYTVSQQVKEIGIRLALGANSGTILRMVMFAGMRFILAGTVLGLLAAFLVLRLMRSQIANVSTYDPLTLASAIAVLTLVGMAACYLPSLRAMRVDPLVSLRHE